MKMQKDDKEVNLQAERNHRGKHKRDKNVNAAGEEKIGKVERNRRRKGIRQKPSQERHESKKGNKKKDRGKQAKTKS